MVRHARREPTRSLPSTLTRIGSCFTGWPFLKPGNSDQFWIWWTTTTWHPHISGRNEHLIATEFVRNKGRCSFELTHATSFENVTHIWTLMNSTTTIKHGSDPHSCIRDFSCFALSNDSSLSDLPFFFKAQTNSWRIRISPAASMSSTCVRTHSTMLPTS